MQVVQVVQVFLALCFADVLTFVEKYLAPGTCILTFIEKYLAPSTYFLTFVGKRVAPHHLQPSSPQH